jgi:hypothetical protein
MSRQVDRKNLVNLFNISNLKNTNYSLQNLL